MWEEGCSNHHFVWKEDVKCSEGVLGPPFPIPGQLQTQKTAAPSRALAKHRTDQLRMCSSSACRTFPPCPPPREERLIHLGKSKRPAGLRLQGDCQCRAGLLAAGRGGRGPAPRVSSAPPAVLAEAPGLEACRISGKTTGCPESSFPLTAKGPLLLDGLAPPPS